MKPVQRNRRLVLLAVCGVTLAGAAGLTLSALQDNISYFFTPSEIGNPVEFAGRNIRLGGLVMEGSVRFEEDVQVYFNVTDGAATLPVTYRGILPDLFREGQGVIAQGQFDTLGQFIAASILAKHDEKYVPKELKEGLEKAGHPKDITS